MALYLGWIGGPEQDDVFLLPCDADTAYDPTVGACAPAPGAEAAINNVDRGGANEFEAWKHLIDLVVTFNPDDALSLVFNADYGVQGTRVDLASSAVDTQRYYGGMLGARYALDEVWAISGRGEYLADPDGFLTGVTDGALATGTLTFEAKPTDNLILRLDGRGDFMVGGENDEAKKVFQKETREAESSQLTAVIGAVVTTN
jgi:hypothetical protein